MSKVRASPLFAEYEDDHDAAFPTSQWIRKLPRIVEGLARRLPGPGSPSADPTEPPTTSAAPPTTPASLLDRVHFIASTTFADQVACGAAAGAAAAFRAPIGGMLYLMELSTRWRLELTWRTFFSTSISVLVLMGLSHACKGNSVCQSVQSFLSVSGSGDYVYSFTSPYEQLPLLIVFAAMMGWIGSAFIWLNCSIVKLRRRWGHSKRLLLLEAVVFTWCYSIMMYGIAASGDCRPCDRDAPNSCNPGLSNAFSSLNCQPNEYNPVATLISSPNGDNIRSLWTVRYEDFSLRALVMFASAYFLAAAWTAGLALPSGSFSSTLLLGSCLGRIMAHLVRRAGIIEDPDAPLFSLLGAAALFTGQMRMTVSLCVVLLEMCNTQGTLPFLMIVIIVAKGAADRLGDSLVVRRIKLKGLPFIARMPHLSQRRGRLSAATIVRKGDFPLLPPEPTGHLIRQLLNQHPSKPLFVVVRPHAASKPPLADLAMLLSAQAASRTQSLQLGADASLGSATSVPTWHPASLSPFPDGAATPWESASSATGGDPQKHVLMGVIARSTLVKLLAHLEIMTAAGQQPGRGVCAVDTLATASSGCSAIGIGPFGSIPEENHAEGSVREPLLRRARTQPSLTASKDGSLLEAAEDQRLLEQQQEQLATTLAVAGEDSPAMGLLQRVRSARSMHDGVHSPGSSDSPPPRTDDGTDTPTPWPPSKPVQQPGGPRMEYRHKSHQQQQSISRDWVARQAAAARGGSPEAAVLDDADVEPESPPVPRSIGSTPFGDDDDDPHVIDMAPRRRDLQSSRTARFFQGSPGGSAHGTSVVSFDAGAGDSSGALWSGERLHSVAAAAVEDVAEAAADRRGGLGAEPQAAVVDGLGGGADPCSSDEATAFLDAKIDLSSAIQVPPIQMDPRVSLEAIFNIMNNMALEIVPIVSTGGVYHGLVTRACMMRFQKKMV